MQGCYNIQLNCSYKYGALAMLGQEANSTVTVCLNKVNQTSSATTNQRDRFTFIPALQPSHRHSMLYRRITEDLNAVLLPVAIPAQMWQKWHRRRVFEAPQKYQSGTDNEATSWAQSQFRYGSSLVGPRGNQPLLFPLQ